MANPTSEAKILPRASSFAPVSARSLLLFGGMPALIVFGLLFYAGYAVRKDEVRLSNLRGLVIAQAALDDFWGRGAFWADLMAQRLHGANKKQTLDILSLHKELWPQATFTLYGEKGEVIPFPGESPVPASAQRSASADRTVQEMVAKAITGQPSKNYTDQSDHLAMSACAPVQAGAVKAVLVSIPLDTKMLLHLKDITHAEIAVINLDELATTKAVGTLFQSQEFFAADVLPSFEVPEENTSAPLSLQNTTQHVGIAPLRNAAGLVIGILIVAPPHASGAAMVAWHVLAALAMGVAGICALLWWQYRREGDLVSTLAGTLNELAEVENISPQPNWPAQLAAAFRNVAGALTVSRAVARKAVHEREEARRQMQESSGQRPVPYGEEYRRFFENSPHGIFQTEVNGKFIQVNPSFAAILGYDSPMHLLTECPSLTDLCLQQEEGALALGMLCEPRRSQHTVTLRRRDGKARHFTLLCMRSSPAEEGEQVILEGFLLDRSLEEQMEQARRERDTAKGQSVSLALLLASTCQQAQSYLIPSVRKEDCAAEGAEEGTGQAEAALSSFAVKSVSAGALSADSLPINGGKPAREFDGKDREAPQGGSSDDSQQNDRYERRKSVTSLTSMFDDIYQIAVAEVESSQPVAAPIDLGRLMERLCRQALPAMRVRNIALHCEMENDLVLRVSGSASLLRHALLRALLIVIAPVTGGRAYLSVSRDPNAPRSAGTSRLLFSASWSGADIPAGQVPQAVFPGGLGFVPETGTQIFSIAGLNIAPEQEVFEGISLNTAEELSIIQFLVQKMHGELLEGVFNSDLRCLQLIVQLEHLSSKGDAENGAENPASASEPSGAGQESLSAFGEYAGTPGAQETGGRIPSYSPENGLGMDAEPASINLLVMDEEPPVESYVENAPEPEGLDILLVDDSLNNRLLFSLFLRETRHRITEAHDGQEGVEAFQRKKFDVIFMDMEMPLMDGYQATRIIRALEADNDLPSTPIVAQTAHALPEFKQQCMLSGCSEFLSKPFSKNALLTMLDAFVQIKADSRRP